MRKILLSVFILLFFCAPFAKGSVNIYGIDGSSIDFGVEKDIAHYVVTAREGEGVTQLAGRVIEEYLRINKEDISGEQKIYAEDYLRRKISNQAIFVGTEVRFRKTDIEEAVEKAKNLDEEQIDNLGKYLDVTFRYIETLYEKIIKERLKTFAIYEYIIGDYREAAVDSSSLNPLAIGNQYKKIQNTLLPDEAEDFEIYRENPEIYKEDPWISDVCEGVDIYYIDLNYNYRWKNSKTACDPPQCKEWGAENEDNLVDDSDVDFSEYPAMEACQKIGGRLPSKEELLCMLENRYKVGLLSGSYYPSNMEFSESGIWVQDFSKGYPYYMNKGDKMDFFKIRCVKTSEY